MKKKKMYGVYHGNKIQDRDGCPLVFSTRKAALKDTCGLEECKVKEVYVTIEKHKDNSK